MCGTTEPPEPRGRLAPIRIFTSELELDGFVAPAGQRITDILLRGMDLPFLPAGANAVPENWISISAAEILLASPPPLPHGSWMGARREKQRASFRIGGYAVTGTAHIGHADMGGVRVHRPSFVPLTDAELTREGRAERPESYGVLIVHVALAEGATLPERARPGPVARR